MQLFELGSNRSISARAKIIGERLDLRALETTDRIGATPLMVRAGAQGGAVLFRYGVVVLFNLAPVEEMAFLEQIKPLITDPLPKPEVENVDVIVDDEAQEGVDKRGILLKEPTVERLQLVADVLSKSAVLSYYEVTVAGIFDRIEPLAANLKTKGRGGYRNRELLRQIGDILLMHHRMVGRVEVREKPELLWERPELERLYLRLADEYELSERHSALERKLELIARTAETLVELVRHRSTLRVEWYIVLLIVVEILLMLTGHGR